VEELLSLLIPIFYFILSLYHIFTINEDTARFTHQVLRG